MEKDFEKVLANHTIRDGVFACPLVGKNNVTVVTLHRGFKACGHCIATLHDEDGNKIPYTLRELLTK